MLSQNRFTHTPSQPAVTTALLPRASKVISKELEFLKKEITKLEASSEMINGVQNEVITKLEIVSRDSKAKKGDLADVQAAQKNLDASTKVFDTHNQDLERARATITTLESELLEAQMVEALVKAALDYDTLKAEYAKLEAGLIEFMTKTSMRMSKLRTQAYALNTASYTTLGTLGNPVQVWVDAVLDDTGVSDRAKIAIGYPSHGSSIIDGDFTNKAQLIEAFNKNFRV